MKRISTILAMLAVLCLHGARGQEATSFSLSYSIYASSDCGTFYRGANVENVYHDGQTATVGGKVYSVVCDDVTYVDQATNTAETRRFTIHLRREGKRLLAVYDEYKALMQAKGCDMTRFDEQCQYETTAEGEMVLYDFGMEAGDRFRSVPGKEDVYVVKKQKDWLPNQFPAAGQEPADVLVLSNGALVIDGIGYACTSGSSRADSFGGTFFDYLNVEQGLGNQLELAYVDKQLVFENYADAPHTTAVETTRQTAKPAARFDLSGRRLPEGSRPQGVCIENGHTVVRK